MKKIVILALVGLATAAVAGPSAVAQPQKNSQTKAWLCHKTSATFANSSGTFVKYVAIRVSGRAQVRAHLAHGDQLVSPRPTGSLKAQRQAARSACANLRVPAPLSPDRGGVELDAALSGGGVSATLSVRTQVGQTRLCFSLNVTGPSGATVSLSSLTLSEGATTISIPSSQLTGTSASSCITLENRDLAKQVLDGGFTATLTGTVTPSGGSASNFTATGMLAR